MFPRGTVSRTHAKQRKQSAFCGELSVAHICFDEVNTPELTGTSASGEGRWCQGAVGAKSSLRASWEL